MKKFFKFALALLVITSLVACGNKSEGTDEPNVPEVETHELQIGAAYHAAHGTKGFASATVVVEQDTVVLAFLDEYQVISTESFVGVPNSENFVDYFNDPANAFGSKRVNNEAYSANMAERGGATVAIAENFNAIQDFVVGKTIAELTEIVNGTDEAAVDAVTGATLVDTRGYIQTIVLAAEAAQANAKNSYEGELSALTIGQVDNAPHGTKSFGVTTVVTAGETVVLAYLDEFQFMAADANVGVPNSEAYDIVADYVLASKRVNAESYSANMAEKAGSTVALNENYDIIQAYVANQTVADLTALVAKTPEEVVDTVTGATLVDTIGYITGIVEAATNSK